MPHAAQHAGRGEAEPGAGGLTALAGTRDGPDGQPVPNITPDRATGIGDWDTSDIVALLKTGRTPEQGAVKGAMREAVRDGLKFLTDADLQAIATYLQAQKPVAAQ